MAAVASEDTAMAVVSQFSDIKAASGAESSVTLTQLVGKSVVIHRTIKATVGTGDEAKDKYSCILTWDGQETPTQVDIPVRLAKIMGPVPLEKYPMGATVVKLKRGATFQ